MKNFLLWITFAGFSLATSIYYFSGLDIKTSASFKISFIVTITLMIVLIVGESDSNRTD